MTTAQIILWGALGALTPDLIRIAKCRRQTATLVFLGRRQYWGGLAVQLVLGILAAYLMTPASVREAVAFGFCAPEILTRVLSKPATDEGTRSFGFTESVLSLREWWAR